MNKILTLLLAILVGAPLLGMVGCQRAEEAGTETGEAMEEAVDETADAMDEAADEVDDQM